MIQIDRTVIQQVLGSLMQKPLYLSDTDKYRLDPNDFPNRLDRFIYTAIYNLYLGGAEAIHTVDVDLYLKTNPLAKETMEKENGIQFLQDCESYAEPQNFNYYYSKLKKLNLLRDLQKSGNDISKFYCEDSLDDDYIAINERFEKLTTTDIINQLKGGLATLENDYCFNQTIEETSAADGIFDLIQELQEKPEVGIKLQGDIFNTITRGGRKGTLFLRSANSGGGKSRLMVGDACQIAYPIRFEPHLGRWVSTGKTEPVLYVMTEQDPREIQTMVLAYLTGFNEEIFKYGTFTDPAHMEVVNKAIEIMEKYKDNLLFARIPDPCASVVKNLFRRYNLQKNVENFFFDYIFSSPAMLEEYRDLKLREDVALRLFTTALKNLAIELNSFVMTATQISEQDNDKKNSWKDYHNIAAARSIAHLIDFGCIVSRPTQEELKQIEGFTKLYNLTPNFVVDVYKNRGGRWTMLRIWAVHDLGTCRRCDLFVTTPDLKPIDDFQIVDFVEEKDAEMKELEDYFNEGQISFQTATQLLNEIAPEVGEVDLREEVEEAFGDFNERKKRVASKGFDDLL